MIMREIKFRAWDNDDKSYFKPTYEAYKGRLEDLSISLCGDILRRTFLHCSEHQSCFPDKYILEQYTGFKDKNGTEIYEGDIIQGNKKRLVVFFHNGCFQTEFGLLAFSCSTREVIGNIHQNPELT